MGENRENFNQSIFSNIKELIRLSIDFPSNVSSKATIYRDIPGYTELIDKLSDNLINSIQRLTDAKNLNANFALNQHHRDVTTSSMGDSLRISQMTQSTLYKFIEDKMAVLADVNDTVLDRADLQLDFLDKNPDATNTQLAEFADQQSSSSASTSNANVRDVTQSSFYKMTSSKGNVESSTEMARRVLTLITSAKIARPQTVYRMPPAQNDRAFRFCPPISVKPNSVDPLAECFQEAQRGAPLRTWDQPMYPHPYQLELFNWTPPPITSSSFSQNNPFIHTAIKQSIQKKKGKNKKRAEKRFSIDDGRWQLVDSVDKLEAMIHGDLKRQRAIAVDVEHHQMRSYLGLTCLIQISTLTGKKNGVVKDDENEDDDNEEENDKSNGDGDGDDAPFDYIIDTFPLHAHIHKLNHVFTDPAIIKVLHGASHDVLWLQRDFGVYIVSLFDTGLAAKQLNLPHHSLSYLLENFVSDEHHQQQSQSGEERYDEEEEQQQQRRQNPATFWKHKDLQCCVDWRIRPLPAELIQYARNDTHWLLQVAAKLYDRLAASNNNKLEKVWFESRNLCMSRFEKASPASLEVEHLRLLSKCQVELPGQSLWALRKLCQFRHEIAAREDENPLLILPNPLLLNLARQLPKELPGVLACQQQSGGGANPEMTTSISRYPIVSKYGSDLLRICLEARIQREEELQRIPNLYPASSSSTLSQQSLGNGLDDEEEQSSRLLRAFQLDNLLDRRSQSVKRSKPANQQHQQAAAKALQQKHLKAAPSPAMRCIFDKMECVDAQIRGRRISVQSAFLAAAIAQIPEESATTLSNNDSNKMELDNQTVKKRKTNASVKNTAPLQKKFKAK